MYQVYVLYSPTFHKTYVGYTSNLEQRFLSHNHLATKGYTIKFRPWEILHQEEFENKKDAILREKELKAGKGREFIKSLILQKYP